jgi:hypothetical protein
MDLALPDPKYHVHIIAAVAAALESRGIPSLSPESLHLIATKCQFDVSRAWRAFLETDLRELGLAQVPELASLGDGVHTCDGVEIKGPLFSQVLSCQNIAQPRKKQTRYTVDDEGDLVVEGSVDGKRMLLLKLTDGKQKFTAIEFGPLISPHPTDSKCCLYKGFLFHRCLPPLSSRRDPCYQAPSCIIET